MPEAQDPYLQAGTDVLRNVVGLRNPQTLATYEYEVSALRMAEFQHHPIEGRFDLRHLCAIHRHIFQDVYAWAGEIRTVSISKGGSFFATSSRLQSSGIALHNALVRENFLRGLHRERFVERLTEHLSDWNALHPFREGNGRATRTFIRQLAWQAGYDLDTRRIAQDVPGWNDACRDSFFGHQERLGGILSRAVRHRRAIAFESLERTAALRQHPELAPLYRSLDDIATQAGQALPGAPAQQAAVLARVRGALVQALDSGLPVTSPALQARATIAPAHVQPAL